MIRFLLTLLLVSVVSSVYADTRIYLIPRVVSPGEELQLGRFARIETSVRGNRETGDILIDKSLYEDGHIGRGELSELLEKHIDGPFTVYGNGVAIVTDREFRRGMSGSGEQVVVKKGKTVRLVVRRNGVAVEVIGEAMRDGRVGEIIPVKIDRSRTVNGTVSSRKLVIVML